MNVKLSKYMNSNTPAHVVTIGSIELYFSYETIIAFRAPNIGLIVRENDWGSTTGKHLNAIDGGNKSQRKHALEFQILLQLTLETSFLQVLPAL